MPAAVPTQAEFDALAARVTKLEGGVTPPTPTPGTPSKTGTYITKPTDLPIIDDALNAWTLVAGPAGIPGQQIAANGTVDPVTAQVTKLGIDLVSGARAIVQQNAAGSFYTASGPGQSWQQISGPDGPPLPAGSLYRVAGGQLHAPDGSVWRAHGINMLDGQIGISSPARLLSWFPKLNGVRLAVGGEGGGYANAQPKDRLVNWINAATAAGLVVLVDDHVTGQPQANSVNLGAQYAWKRDMAATLKDNRKVWFTSANEVGPAGLRDEHLNSYKAVRDAGNPNPIALCVPFGNPELPPDPSIYRDMTGVFWDQHSYAWMYGQSQNVGDCANGLRGNIAKLQNFVQSKDGVIPVCIAEFGNGAGSGSHDPGGDANVLAVLQVAPGYSGSFAWLVWWPGAPNPPGTWPADDLCNQYTGQITGYGSIVRDAM